MSGGVGVPLDEVGEDRTELPEGAARRLLRVEMSARGARQGGPIRAGGSNSHRPDRRYPVLHGGIEGEYPVAGVRLDRLSQHGYRAVAR